MTQLKYRYRFLLIGVLLLVTVLPKDVARADVGVPPAHPGYSLSPGDLVTNVQMVSEEVVIVINEDPFKASVEAVFHMRNNGTEDEEIEVWFPFGERLTYSKGLSLIQVQDFQTWVENEKMDITIEQSDEWNLIWAHWPVTFPADTPVMIRVSYELSPDFLSQPFWFGGFHYILETGAGWQGVIEKAEIIVQTPYPLDVLDDLLGINYLFHASPGGFSVNPSGVQWLFNDLEPTEADNINFSMLSPENWRAIYESYLALESNPDKWETHESLARGLSSWIGTKEAAELNGDTAAAGEITELIELAGNSYKKVLELSPPDKSRYISALHYFMDYPDVIESYQLQNYFNEAVDFFPENEQIRGDYDRAVEKGLITDGAASISPTLPVPTATIAPANPTETAASIEPSTSNNSPSFSLMMGILFIGTAAVLIIVAVKRGRNKDGETR